MDLILIQHILTGVLGADSALACLLIDAALEHGDEETKAAVGAIAARARSQDVFAHALLRGASCTGALPYSHAHQNMFELALTMLAIDGAKYRRWIALAAGMCASEQREHAVGVLQLLGVRAVHEELRDVADNSGEQWLRDLVETGSMTPSATPAEANALLDARVSQFIEPRERTLLVELAIGLRELDLPVLVLQAIHEALCALTLCKAKDMATTLALRWNIAKAVKHF